MTELEEMKAKLAAAEAAAVAAQAAEKKVLRPRITDVKHEVTFALPDGVYGIELLSISYKDGSQKDANGKLIVVTEPYEGQPNLRAWLMIKAVGLDSTHQLCQEYAKANGCKFENVLEDGDETILKTGAKLNVFNGIMTYHM